MARPLGSGPIHVFVGLGPPGIVMALNALGVSVPVVGNALFPTPAPVTAGGAIYYGTTQSGPQVNEELAYYSVMNDLTGPTQPFDRGYAGREDTVSLVMSSWTQFVDNLLEQFLRPAAALPVNAGGRPLTPGRGVDALSDLGTMMATEGKTVGLWLLKASALKPINVLSGMPIGRYYYTATMLGPNQLVEGNKENLRVRIFKCQKNIQALNTGMLPLFSENPLDFAGLPATSFG